MTGISAAYKGRGGISWKSRLAAGSSGHALGRGLLNYWRNRRQHLRLAAPKTMGTVLG